MNHGNKPISFFWFRRDLRLDDNAGLYYALRSDKPIVPLFIFDSDIIDKLEDKRDARLVFIHRHLQKLNEELLHLGSSLLTRYGKPIDVWKKLLSEFTIDTVFTNHDYEPYAIRRDNAIETLLEKNNIHFRTYKDQVIFEKSEIVKDDGQPYTVFTPYMKKWRRVVNDFYRKPYPVKKYFRNFHKLKSLKLLTLEQTGFEDFEISFPDKKLSLDVLKNYEKYRDIPGVAGTTHLSVHLRFGTVSIRNLINKAWEVSDQWINELIWREFYMMILWHFPHVTERAFRTKYDRLAWRNDEKGFISWCEGKTGYPIVDAGMRELNTTGFMHNRLRMITSMFLTKYLLIDWRWGEAYFAQKLLDFELSSNNGGWQWSAGTGVDAAPYFRIFNMHEQTKRFDPSFSYINRWVPEFMELNYPKPMVDYKEARQRCLQFFRKAGI